MKSIIFRGHFLLMALGLIAIAQSAPAQLLSADKRSVIVKGERDTREYRYITLANQLKVLLVSDPKAEKSAAALTIPVGTWQNPEQRPGLAQLLVGVLPAASEKYPEAGSFQRFVQQQGGEQHSLAEGQSSQFYFAIGSTFFESALDRFAGFFIAPLLPADAVEAAKNSLNSEYLSSVNEAKLSHSLRELDVYRSLFNPEHPSARFPGGNLETLVDSAQVLPAKPQGSADVDADTDKKGPGRDDLLSFYRDYYSANLMSLAVVGNQSLDQLQKMVEAIFTPIPNSNKVLAAASPPLFNAGTLPASLSIQSATELQQLSFTFPVANFAASYQTKPWAYIAHLLRGEGEGSLLSLLKNLGWAEAISISEMPVTSQDNLFQISLTLTAEGAKAKDQIASALFEYLKMIAQQGITDWRFAELQQMAAVGLRFQEPLPPLQTATELAQAMQAYPAKDVLRGKYIYSLFDEDLIRLALSYLRKDNVMVAWLAPEVKTTTLSRYYQVPYAAVPGISKMEELKPLYRQKLALPERNVFMPKNTLVKVPSMRFAQGDASAKSSPRLLFSNDQSNLWFLQDQLYRSPKAELNFRVILPILNNSLENAARNQLFIALVMDKLDEATYAANFAGLTFAATANARGFDLHISGYTDRLSLLVSKIASTIAQASFSQQRFERVKERVIQRGREQDKSAPAAILVGKISRLQYQPYWDSNEYADALEKTSFSAFKSFANELLRDAKMDSLFYGNLYPQDAIKLAALVDHQLLQKKGNRVLQSAKGLRTDNGSNKSWLHIYPIASEQHSLALYIPALSPTIGSAAQSLLLNQILQSAFASKLHGGRAELLSVPLKNLESSVLILQWPQASSAQMLSEINGFFAEAPALIAQNFTAGKTELLSQLRKTPESLAQQSEKFWQSILLGDINFSRQQELVAAVNGISAESLLDYYTKTFLQKNRRLWLSSVEIDNEKEFERIGNIAEYQQKQQGYLYP